MDAPARGNPEDAGPIRRRRGSVLVIVMVTLLFTAAALVTFLDKASNDLLVEAHVAVANRLRMDAYSAMEVTLAVLQDFVQAGNGLHSAGEGWGDPLSWAGWAPADGNRVEVTFDDESGKIPLIHADANILRRLFVTWGMNDNDSQRLVDALLGWTRQSYVASTGVTPDYENSALPYLAPERSLRSYGELAAIDYAREVLYDKSGLPNDLWWRFCKDVSLFDFPRPNINGANGDVLAAVGQFTDGQQQNISSYLNGSGDYAPGTPLGRQWFSGSNSVTGVVGSAGAAQDFGYTVLALRVQVTVHEGSSQFRLATVVSPQGGARTVQTTATDLRKGSSTSGSSETAARNGLGSGTTQTSSTATASQAAAASNQKANLQYPFTVLEILENDQILAPPPPRPSTI